MTLQQRRRSLSLSPFFLAASLGTKKKRRRAKKSNGAKREREREREREERGKGVGCKKKRREERPLDGGTKKRLRRRGRPRMDRDKGGGLNRNKKKKGKKRSHVGTNLCSPLLLSRADDDFSASHSIFMDLFFQVFFRLGGHTFLSLGGRESDCLFD